MAARQHEVEHLGALSAATDRLLVAHEIHAGDLYGGLSAQWTRDRGVCPHCLGELAEMVSVAALEIHGQGRELEEVLRDQYVSGYTACLALVRP
jgi:hypothetical protein